MRLLSDDRGCSYRRGRFESEVWRLIQNRASRASPHLHTSTQRRVIHETDLASRARSKERNAPGPAARRATVRRTAARLDAGAPRCSNPDRVTRE